MVRAIWLCLAVPLVAAAQPGPVVEVVEFQSKSPEYSQEKLFVASDQAKLDPQSYLVDLAFVSSPIDDPKDNVAKLEVEMGLSRHFQLHLAQDATAVASVDGLLQGGTEVGVRYTLAEQYDGIPGNPTVELLWHPRQGNPASVGGKVTASGEVKHGLVGVANLHIDENLVGRPGNGPGEVGGSLGASQVVIADRLRVGAEMDLAFVQTGWFASGAAPEQTQGSVKLGPNAMVKAGPVNITGAVLFDVAAPTVKVDPYLTVGMPF